MTTSGAPRSGAATEPPEFRTAVDSLHTARVRPEIEVGAIRPPQRLAPYSYAIGAEIRQSDDAELDAMSTDSQGSAFGRLILLYDPDGQEAWNGNIRLVAYIQAEVEEDLASDPLLPEVAWSWLTDALGTSEGATSEEVTALGGTVTSTTSVRFGDIAGPPRAHQLELRASWTATRGDVASHLEAFSEALASAAGLPPLGITELKSF
ncbi:DUF3000 domain-containing protein [Gordonia sp. TBRC 11910]|uniref:DUF3000 domain-containing protein n=1 Tax=Gordonia asplenii TaxID=2725283 RepID=A0A848KPM4_9ACTN|nr:DUF3000 domain-containing protein [Gordonia asplenii]NMN99968.1 DUF3000 domain-containing protein [Gordonia asplenii]